MFMSFRGLCIPRFGTPLALPRNIVEKNNDKDISKIIIGKVNT